MCARSANSGSLGAGRKLVFAGVLLFVFFGAVEIAARVLESRSAPAEVLPEPIPNACAERQDCVPGAVSLPALPPDAIPMVEEHRAGWGFVPGSVVNHGNVLIKINSLGLRGREPSGDKAPDELRLLSLGDSTVYGFGVRETSIFGNVAANGMSESLGRPVVHFNAALPGYSSTQAQLVLDDIGEVVRPDWIIVACIWSDLFHAAHAPDARERVPLASYRALVRLLGPWLPPRRIGWWDPELGVGTPGEGRSPRTTLAEYMNNLHRLAATATGLGARTVFVALPAPIDLDPDQVPAYISDYRAAMFTVAEKNGAPFVNGPEYFLQHGATGAMFYDQVHPSIEGHRLLGEAVASALVEEQ